MSHVPWSPPTSSPQRIAILTPRQADVLTGICHGLSNQQIARSHYLTEQTVKTHAKAVLLAMAARSRTHAAALAYSGAVTVVVKGSAAAIDGMRRHPSGRRFSDDAA